MHMLRAAWARILARSAKAGFRPVRPMTSITRGASRRHAERGQTLAEYALILGLIAVIAIIGLAFLGGAISELFWDPISEEFGKVLDDIFGP